MNWKRCLPLTVFLCLGMGQGAVSLALSQGPGQPGAPPEPLPTFRYDEHVLLPLRVHLLKAAQLPDAQTTLQPGDVARILGKVNGIWRQAGIQFYLTACDTEDAAKQDFVLALAANRTEAHLLLLRPEGSRTARTLHVYYVHSMNPNGIFLQPDGIFVKDSARLRPVEGGIDEPLPRVTAHELGHALSLSHRQDTFNLLASGTTGTSLNRTEVTAARAAAARLGWARTPAELDSDRRKAAEARKPQAAADLDRCLAGIPGDSPLKQAAEERLRASPAAGPSSTR